MCIIFLAIIKCFLINTIHMVYLSNNIMYTGNTYHKLNMYIIILHVHLTENLSLHLFSILRASVRG
jgi:hypothetical protein